MFVCICAGSVNIFSKDFIQNQAIKSIVFSVRLPRVLTVAFTGASLSLCGAVMQGLLKNPMADGSTLGVSSGASLGAVLAILLNLPVTPVAIAFAFLSLVLILFLSHKIDLSLSTNTIILVGIIFSMFASSLISLCITFAGNKVNTITFWTLGSLAGSDYKDVLLIGISFCICSAIMLYRGEELNAFAIGEENAFNLGVNINRVKLELLITVSILTGTCVSIGGTIGFVGLIVPHMTRYITGANHKKLLPVSIFAGANILLIADLISRTVAIPKELPIGVITSIFGVILFIFILIGKREES